MKKILIVTLMLLLVATISFAQENPTKIYTINLKYDNGDVSLIESEIAYGYPDDNILQPDKGYTVNIVSFSNNVLDSFRFEFPSEFFYDTGDPKNPGGSFELTESEKSLLIPYFRNGKNVEIYDSNMAWILSVDISQFAEVCVENGECEAEYDENSNNCPNDCKDDIEINLTIVISLVVVLLIILIITRRKKVKYVYKRPAV
ncbi:MAG: hypothetical protein ABIE55_03415 [Candidatus Aenigmatarchaeota archaeon]